MPHVRTSVAAVGLVLAVAGGYLLTDAGARPTPAAAEGLTRFDDCDQLTAWYRSAALAELTRNQSWGGPELFDGSRRSDGGAMPLAAGGGLDTAAASAATPGAAALTTAAGPSDTGTNVQEAGVDEADLVKRSGDRLVIVRAGRLYIVDVTGPQPVQVGEVRLPGTGRSLGTGELLLAGNRALVLSAEQSDDVVLGGPEVYRPHPARSGLTLVDLTDPAAPRVLESLTVDGTSLSARLTAGTMRVVVSSSPTLPWRYPTQWEDRVLDRTRRANDALARAAGAADWLPRAVLRDGAGSTLREGPLLECGDVTHPVADAGSSTLTVLTVAPGGSLADADRTAIVASGDLIYASTDRLYVATTRADLPRPLDRDTDSDTATGTGTGTGGGGGDIAVGSFGHRTELHGFDTTSAGRTSYTASGSVDGTVLGRWALSEHEGHLRVAVTDDATPSGRTDNRVLVLAERDRRLVEVGRVGGLGRGERIRAVRWFGDLATVVTFRQTDPLYTLDVSDPEQPRQLGELKVPGYSAYLHPLGERLLLGVGQDADPRTGRQLGGQLSVFDLRDLADPKQVDVLSLGEGWSEVETESRAFSYDPVTRTALLPVTDYDCRSALVTVRIEPDGDLRETGRWQPETDGWAYDVTTSRTVVLGDRVAAISASGVTLLAADTLQAGRTLALD